MGLGYTHDQPMQAQTAQVIRHLSGGDGLGCFSQKGSPVVAKFAVGETPRQQTEHEQSSKESLYERIGEAQGTGSLTFDRHRLVELAKRVFADRAVVAETLDVQKTSVGFEADLPQSG